MLRKNLPLITVMFCQALLAALAALLYFVTRPELAKVFDDLGGRIQAHTMLALTTWYLPSLVGFALACDVAALAVPRRSVRNALFGVGLVIPALGLTLAVYGLFVPLFQMAPVK